MDLAHWVGAISMTKGTHNIKDGKLTWKEEHSSH
jgi:hypothetical protein